MSESYLDRDLALRVGLAARQLPETEPRQLMAILNQELGHQITKEKMESISVAELQQAADGFLQSSPIEDLQRALKCLKGEIGEESTQLPAIQSYTEGEMPGSIRVAVATNGAEVVDGHFGSCAYFFIYQLNVGKCRLIDIRSCISDVKGSDKTLARAELVKDCHLLYLASIGGPPAARINRYGVHPIKVTGVPVIAVELGRLQQVLEGTPPPWLAKLMAA